MGACCGGTTPPPQEGDLEVLNLQSDMAADVPSKRKNLKEPHVELQLNCETLNEPTINSSRNDNASAFAMQESTRSQQRAFALEVEQKITEESLKRQKDGSFAHGESDGHLNEPVMSEFDDVIEQQQPQNESEPVESRATPLIL